MALIVLHGELVLAEGIVPDGEVIIDKGRIREVNLRPTSSPTVSWREGRILPGLVDLHVHGMDGVDVMDDHPDALAHLDAALARTGCTRYLATTMSADASALTGALRRVTEYLERSPDSGLMGVHFEGPFIHPDQRGAQKATMIRRPSLLEMEQYHREFKGLVRRVTLAPELTDADELIHFLTRVGVRVSLGHSNATYDQAWAAFDAGVEQVTHLFNAMTGLHHREPGLAGAALMRSDVLVELIADGVHLHPAVIRLVARLKGPRQIMLVTDAIRAAGLRDGVYELGGQSVTVLRGVARTEAGNLAGSTLTLWQAVQNFQKFAEVELSSATAAASLVPARAMGWSDVGAIAPGFWADLVLVDDKGKTRMSWRGGEVLFDGR
jgi:N-acetylglucosamine-6-phosphate deacetylase